MKSSKWSTILYPESAVDNWMEILESSMCRVVISPLHDKDMGKDGTFKKAHFHIIILYDGPTTEKHVGELCKSFGGIKPQIVHSLAGYVKYLTHDGVESKHKYSKEEIVYLNGAENRLTDLDEELQKQVAERVLGTIQKYNITNYSVLLNLYMNEEICRKYIVNNVYFLTTYMKSKWMYNTTPSERTIIVEGGVGVKDGKLVIPM